MFLHSLIWHGKGRKYVLSDMKRPVFYVETSIILQKQTVELMHDSLCIFEVDCWRTSPEWLGAKPGQLGARPGRLENKSRMVGG